VFSRIVGVLVACFHNGYRIVVHKHKPVQAVELFATGSARHMRIADAVAATGVDTLCLFWSPI
jgi:succinylarginine dihydrolase